MRPRPEITELTGCPHGGPDHIELERAGLDPDEVLDFSVSANPFGPPSGVREAVAAAVIDRYPDSAAGELRQALSDHLGTPVANIIAGSGSMELIRLIATDYLDRGDTVIIPWPTFGEYELACRIAGAEAVACEGKESDGFRLAGDTLADTIRRRKPRAVFLCNPNNPTGQYLNRDEIEAIVAASESTLVVLDEAYVSFATEPWDSVPLTGRDNVIILRSMTKDYALAGLRLGYACGNPSVIETLRKVCPPWNVSAPAQAAGLAALKDKDYLPRCREGIARARDFLIRKLTELGLPPLPSQAHFFLVRAGDAAALRGRLLREGIMVRDCASFGLPEYVRIAPRTMPECEKLIEAIRRNRG